jgi:hypothetical protein
MLEGMPDPDQPDLISAVRLRVQLVDAEPAVWRVVDVRASATLADLHQVLQCALGWTDSHLHAFTSRPPYEPGPPRDFRRWTDFDLPIEQEDGAEDERDTQVRELFGRGRPPVYYEYDFGDSWEHTVEWVEDTAAEAGPDWMGALVDGGGMCPLEDSGGIGGWADKVETVADPRAEDHEFIAAWAAEAIGGDGLIDAGFFDRPAAEERLARLQAIRACQREAAGRGRKTVLDGLASRLTWGQLMWLTGEYGVLPEALAVLGDEPGAHLAQIRPDQARTLLRDYLWLTARVAREGDRGLRLTQTGKLPVAVVKEAFATMAPDGGDLYKTRWIEDDSPRIGHLRRSSEKLGLLRKTHNVLRLTSQGAKVADDPPGMLKMLVARLARQATDPVQADEAALIALQAAFLAEREANRFWELAADGLGALGWATDGFSPPTARDARALAPPLWMFLRSTETVTEEGGYLEGYVFKAAAWCRPLALAYLASPA